MSAAKGKIIMKEMEKEKHEKTYNAKSEAKQQQKGSNGFSTEEEGQRVCQSRRKTVRR